jgi:hypothetical protein
MLGSRKIMGVVIYRERGSIMAIWGHRWPWAARLVWNHGRMGYHHRWRLLAPITTHFKVVPYRDYDC